MSTPDFSVIICIHNALEDVRNCLDSVLRTDFSGQIEIILIDDGSNAPTRDYVHEMMSAHDQVMAVRREKAGGYTVAANTGLRLAKGEIIALLNSDTIVPRGWAQKITAAFAQNPDIGLFGPLSNAASWQSVPHRSDPRGGWAVNALPRGVDVDAMDVLVEAASPDDLPLIRVPLVNGFCYCIRKSVIQKVGYLDEASFPRGFGEEDDYCFRIAEAGFGIAILPTLYVFHAKSKSYGVEGRKAIVKKSAIALKEKHSEARLQRSVGDMKANPYIDTMRQRILDALEERGLEAELS